MPVTELKSKNDYAKYILQSSAVTVLDAYATWCGPCKAIAPVLDKLSESTPKAQFYKFDVDAVPDLAQELGITAMPTITVFKDGELVDSVRGANPSAIQKVVEAALGA